MPVLLTERDPVLISIDLQRLEDLGIPAVAGHESVNTLYGVFGVMRPVILVPPGWVDVLEEHGPIETEWDEDAWARACEDDSAEVQPDAPLPLGAGMAIGTLLAAGCWLALDGVDCISLLYQGSKAIAYSPLQDTTVIGHLKALLPMVLIGAVAGGLAPLVNRGFRTSKEFRILFMLPIWPHVLLLALLYGASARFHSPGKP